MDNSLPNSAPSTPPQIDPNLPPNPPIIPPAHHFRVGLITGICISILGAALIVGGLFFWEKESGPNLNVTPTAPSNEQTQTPPVVSPLPPLFAGDTSDPDHRIVFLRNIGQRQQAILQAWLMTPDGAKQQSLDISNLQTAYKQPASNLLFYTRTDRLGKLYIKNLTTNDTKEFEPVKHPDPEVETDIRIPGQTYISPDGRYVVFTVYFSKACPLPSDGHVPQEGGPCEPDPDPSFPMGNYLFDTLTQKKTLLVGGNDSRLISSWDLPNHTVYMINNDFQKNGLDKIDIQTGQVTRVDNAETFGYGAYPLKGGKTIIRINAKSNDEDRSLSFSKLSLLDTTNHKETLIDQALWADIQPFASISPDEKYFIYWRTDHIQNQDVLGSLHRYNVETGEKTRITPSTESESYSILGVWIDERTFITSVDTVEKGENYRNDNNYLVRIDVPTGKITRLTPKNDVYRFN